MLMSKKKEYKKLLRNNKREYETKKIGELANSKGNSFNFWRKFNNLKFGDASNKIKIPPNKLFHHFSKLLY